MRAIGQWYAEGMIFRYAYRNGVWVDLEQPTAEEVRAIAEEFSIPDNIERELLSPTPLPSVMGNESMLLLVLHFPTHADEHGQTKSQEVDFLVGKQFIITVRYEVVAPLHHLKKLLEAQQLVSGKASVTTDVLLEVLFAHLYTAMREHMNHVADALGRVERDMFEGKERATVRAISNVSRQFLHMESALANQDEALRQFLAALSQGHLLGESFGERAKRIEADRSHVMRIVKTHREIATETRETNIAILGAHQNEIVKTLTVVNFVFLPLGLVTWIFAMRTEGMPLIDSPNAFWIVLGGMAIIGLVLTTFFIRRRWLW